MKESTNIANRFADAYIIAMLDRTSPDDVIARYESAYPELSDLFRVNAKDLELLYGHIRKSDLPSEEKIAEVYHKLRKEDLTPAVSVVPPKEAFASKVLSWFRVRPAVAGASFGLALAVLFAIIWQPWVPREETVPVASDEQQQVNPSVPTPAQTPEIAEGPQTPSSPTEVGPTFRGGKDEQDKGLDKKDRKRLTSLPLDNSLTAPTGVKIIAVADSVIIVRWNAVRNALSYIIEIKRANEGDFKAVSQTGQTQARISGLPSTERIELRVIATSGERKGEASAAKSITIP
jgi:hypothetical protein